MESDSISCPRCKNTKYRKADLKLMVNVCGHALCDSCVDILFFKGSGLCPTCNVSLRKGNFRLKLFEDPFVEKEVDIRKKVLKDFNRKEEDFPTLRDYNDYLEEIEDIIYNLCNERDVEATKKKIEQYKKDNGDAIVKNRGKLSRDQELIEELLSEEMEQESFRKQIVLKEEKDISKVKFRRKEALVDELMYSDQPATEILAIHSNQQKMLLREQEKEQQHHLQQHLDLVKGAVGVGGDRAPRAVGSQAYFSTGIKVGKGSNVFLPLPQVTQEVVYKYTEPRVDPNGPNCPPFDDLESDGYLLHVREPNTAERAGGFLSRYPCYRALQEAFCGLYFKPEAEAEPEAEATAEAGGEAEAEAESQSQS